MPSRRFPDSSGSSRVRTLLAPVLVLIGVGTLAFATVHAAVQPARGATQAPAGSTTTAPARAAVARPAPQVHAVLNQVMQGILFPNSNVIFAAQHDEFAEAKPDPDTSLSTNPITGLYGGWQAVANSSMALAEAANLLIMPGRRCSNGRPVPLTDPFFLQRIQELRDAGLYAYKAAQTKDQDKILDAAEHVASACSHCHSVYREKTPEQGGEKNRCLK